MTLVEVVVAISVFSVVLMLVATMLRDGLRASKVMTVDGELRTRADALLDRISRGLRSTQTGSGALAVSMTASSHSLSFFEVAGGGPSGPAFSPTRTAYSWNPAQITVKPAPPTWAGSKIMGSAPGLPSRAMIGEVTEFSISPTGGFSSESPSILTITLTLTRPFHAPEGQVSVTVSRKVMVPRG